MMRDVLTFVGVFLVCVVVAFMFGLVDLGFTGFFAPKYEQVRRNTFEQSKAYRQGTIQELQRMRFEYVKADQAHKDAMASVILHMAADFDQSAIPTDLWQFLNELKSKKLEGK